MLAVSLLAPLLVGCVTYEEPFEDSLPADGVTLVTADIDRGSFDYRGSSTADTFEILGVSAGTGSSLKRAQRKEEGNSWEMSVMGAALEVLADSRENGRVHFDVDGPDRMDTELVIDVGHVHLDDVEGLHFVDADRITGDDVVGEVDLLSRSGGIDFELLPWEGTASVVDSRSGSVELHLPYGLEYDLEIWGDPEYAMTVEDLGFDTSYLGEGYFSAESGRGTVEVTVYVVGGSFELYETW